jgi:NAD-dependent histone deacetylase SIR2
VLIEIQPDITFFGEDLPGEFGRRIVHDDRDVADLVIVIGTSLKVAPVADVPGIMPSTVPQIYISRTVSLSLGIKICSMKLTPQPVSHMGFDIDLLGDCDVVISELCRRAGWDFKHEMMPEDERVEVVQEEGYESRYTFKVFDA